MLRARLAQLPVIPISILLLFYEFGAALAAGESSASGAHMAQADTVSTSARAIPLLFGERIHPPPDTKRQKSLIAVSPGNRSADVQVQSLLFAVANASDLLAAAPVENKPSKTSSRSTPTVAVERAVEKKLQPQKSPSILQMIEGREREVLIGAAIAVGFFFIGWISGGNYYVRRERRRRTKLRF
jgi:hypothetical protein